MSFNVIWAVCWPASGCRCCDNYFSWIFFPLPALAKLRYPSCDCSLGFHNLTVISAKHGLSLSSSIAYVHFIHWHINMVLCIRTFEYCDVSRWIFRFIIVWKEEICLLQLTYVCDIGIKEQVSERVCDVKWFEVEVDYIIIYYLQMDILSLDFFFNVLYISLPVVWVFLSLVTQIVIWKLQFLYGSYIKSNIAFNWIF